MCRKFIRQGAINLRPYKYASYVGAQIYHAHPFYTSTMTI